MTSVAHNTQIPPLGRWLKRLRAQHDLTQEALAERVNCSVQTIRFFESGRRRPSWEMAELLADALHIPDGEREEFVRTARLIPQEGARAHPAPAEATSSATTPLTTRLPRPLTPLLGRKAECSLLEKLLVDEKRRLVTLVGTPGIGKTRLALHMAHLLAHRFPDGAAFVPLSSVQRAIDLPAAIARALGVTLPGDCSAFEQIDAMITARSLLLVLDNFEHLLHGSDADTVVALLDHLVQQEAEVYLLVTSTERLRIGAESIVELRGLSTTDSEDAPGEAALLYVERTRQLVPDFALTATNRAAVARICALLEGMPLGLELAASWARTLTAAEIADEIARSLDFLTLVDRSMPVRHRSLRTIFEHTWQLMTSEEQRILPRLALFRGGFDRSAALDIAGATVLQIAALIDKSVLRAVEERRGDGTQHVRYSLHGLLRHFLLEKLEMVGELDTLQRRHANYFTALVEQVYPKLFGQGTALWQRALEREQGNLIVALTWALSEAHDLALGLKLAGALSRFWRLAGAWSQARAWLELALACPATDAAIRARALVGLGEIDLLLARYEEASKHLQEGLALWREVGEPVWIAWALFQQGNYYISSGEPAQARVALEESLAWYRLLDNTWGIATVLNQLASTANATGDYTSAATYLDESLRLMRGLGGGRAGLAVSLNMLGRNVLAQGETTQAIGFFEEALNIFTQRNIREGMAWSHINLGLARLQAGQPDAALAELRLCLEIYLELDMIVGVTASLNGLAAVALAQGRTADALRLTGAVDHLCREHQCHLTEFEMRIKERTVAQARRTVADEVAASLLEEGEALPLQQAVLLGRNAAG
jgi:predicted ATPase/DNA-binding XRE family transcriptional regulator